MLHTLHQIYIKETLVSSSYKFDVTCVTCWVLLEKHHIGYITCHATCLTCYKNHDLKLKIYISTKYDQMTLVKY